MLNNVKYPPYRQVQNVESFLNTGNIVVSGAEVKRRTADVMEKEGFPIPEDLLEDFIIISFQDAIANMVKYNEGESSASITVLEQLHPDKKWRGTTSWVTDYVELLLGKAVKRNPYGIWDVFFRHGDLFIFNQGDYSHMLHSLLKSRGELPDLQEILSHGFYNERQVLEEEPEVKYDICVNGKVAAALLHEGIDAGMYVDVRTGYPVKHISNITGPVKEFVSHREVISQEEFNSGLCVREREVQQCQE